MKKCGFEAGLNPKSVETLLVCSRDFVGVVLRARFILIVRLNGPDPSLILLWPGTNSSTISQVHLLLRGLASRALRALRAINGQLRLPSCKLGLPGKISPGEEQQLGHFNLDPALVVVTGEV